MLATRVYNEVSEFREIKEGTNTLTSLISLITLNSLFYPYFIASLLLLSDNINLFAFGVHVIVLAGKAFQKLGRMKILQ